MTDNEALDKFQQMVGCVKHKWVVDDMDSAKCECGAILNAYVTTHEPSPDVRTLWGAMVAARKIFPKLRIKFEHCYVPMGVLSVLSNAMYPNWYSPYLPPRMCKSERDACVAIALEVLEYKEKGE